jgi:hypothetical protein
MTEVAILSSGEAGEGGEEWPALHELSDGEVEANLRSLLGSGARLDARIVVHLAEVEERRIHLRAGRSSMYEYCQKDLGLSDYEAFCRIAAARVAVKYPVIFGMLARRELSLTAIVEVRQFLTEANHHELLSEVSGKTKLQVREALARRFPQADVPERIRKLRAENRAQRAVDPLSADRYKLELTISGELKRQLEQAQELLSHANPSGDLAVVLERALPLLIAKLRSRKFGAGETRTRISDEGPQVEASGADVAVASSGAPIGSSTACLPPDGAVSQTNAAVRKATGHAEQPLAGEPAQRSHIPASVRRDVTARDGEQCAFVDEQGRRCECRAFLQMDHRDARARGGRDTPGNLRWMCRSHNQLLAEQAFGKEHIAAAIEKRRRKGGDSKRAA